jgi:hypothetical protein
MKHPCKKATTHISKHCYATRCTQRDDEVPKQNTFWNTDVQHAKPNAMNEFQNRKAPTHVYL